MNRRRRLASSSGYWPGYVDALVNVVLNLMFLAAMLAVGSFVLGIEISRKILVPTIQTSVEKVQRLIDETLEEKKGSSSSTIEVIDSSPPETSQSVKIDRVRSIENQTVLHVKFDADALQLNDSIRVNLIPRLHEILQLNPGASFTVLAVSETDPQARRISFMRVMALREALNKAGVENSRVVTRILQGTNTTTNGQLVYVLVRSTQNRKETDEQ
jgi:hypothetical protein